VIQAIFGARCSRNRRCCLGPSCRPPTGPTDADVVILGSLQDGARGKRGPPGVEADLLDNLTEEMNSTEMDSTEMNSTNGTSTCRAYNFFQLRKETSFGSGEGFIRRHSNFARKEEFAHFDHSHNYTVNATRDEDRGTGQTNHVLGGDRIVRQFFVVTP